MLIKMILRSLLTSDFKANAALGQPLKRNGFLILNFKGFIKKKNRKYNITAIITTTTTTSHKNKKKTAKHMA